MRHKIVFKTSFILAFFLLLIMGSMGKHIYSSQTEIVSELENTHNEYGKRQLNKIQNITIENEKRILEYITLSLENALSGAMYNLDNVLVKNIMTKALHKENIKAIYLYDNSIKDIFAIGYKENENDVRFINNIPPQISKLKFLTRDIYFEKNCIGVLRLYYDNKHILDKLEISKKKDLEYLHKKAQVINKKIQDEFYIQVIIYIISIVLVILMIIGLLSQYVNSPLQKLKLGLNDFFDFLQNKTDSVSKIDINSDDEFGIMAKSINENIAVSARLHEEIYELNFNLEQKIIDKTVELVEVNNQIQKSIDFASIIQHTFNHEDEIVSHFFDDFFIILQQRETVGGDIVLFEELNDNECLLMVIDCTSHGIPGAFVTMIVKTLQRQIISEILKSNVPINTAEIMYRFNSEIKHLLRQTSELSKSNVGFDGQIIYYNKSSNLVKCSLARNDLIIFDDNKINRIKGDKQSVGYKDSDLKYQFTEHTFEIKDELTVYIYSDGFTDQLGGSKVMPFGNKRTISLIDKIHNKDMPEQKELLIKELKEYQGDNDQNDDISFVGLKFKHKVS